MNQKSFKLMLVVLVTVLALPLWISAEGATGGAAKGSADPGEKVNINTASTSELVALPGIGPKIAEKIVSYRQEHGKFQKLEDLMAVKGIGEKKFAQLKPYITVQ